MINDRYWIYIQQALGYGNNKIKSILDKYKTAENFYSNYKTCDFLTDKEKEKLMFTDLSVADGIMTLCLKYRQRIVTPEDDEYPEQLKITPDMPAVLYVKGDLTKIANKLCLAVVGSRREDHVGKEITEKLAYRLAESGCVIVSGGASGCDTTAHMATMKAGGFGILVLGASLDISFYMETLQLREYLTENGAIISEFAPLTTATKFTFPVRNRIIAALSMGVLVTQAPWKSGSLITASHALKSNTPVFTVPASVFEETFAGNNMLLKKGAIIVTGVMDVLCHFLDDFSYLNISNCVKNIKNDVLTKKEKDAKSGVEKGTTANISETAEKIYELSIKYDTITIDKILENIKEPVNNILAGVTELEINGLLKSIGGKKFIVK